MKMWTDLSSILSQSTRVTDRQTGRRTDWRTEFSSLDRVCCGLHSMQRGNDGPSRTGLDFFTVCVMTRTVQAKCRQRYLLSARLSYTEFSHVFDFPIFTIWATFDWNAQGHAVGTRNFVWNVLCCVVILHCVERVNYSCSCLWNTVASHTGAAQSTPHPAPENWRHQKHVAYS